MHIYINIHIYLTHWSATHPIHRSSSGAIAPPSSEAPRERKVRAIPGLPRGSGADGVHNGLIWVNMG